MVQVRHEEVTLTPGMAKEWLKKNIGNRPLRPADVAAIQADIARDRFLLSPDPITFATDGRMVNGQHRVSAVARGVKAVRVLVARNWDIATNNVLDAGRTRSAADTVGIALERVTGKKIPQKDVAKIAGAVRFLIRYESGLAWPTLASNEREECSQKAVDQYIVEHTAELAENLQEVKELLRRIRSCPLTVPDCLGLLTIFKRIDPQQAKGFMHDVIRGSKLEEDSAAFCLRDYLPRAKSDKAKGLRIEKRLATISAWNLYRRGVKVKSGDSLRQGSNATILAK